MKCFSQNSFYKIAAMLFQPQCGNSFVIYVRILRVSHTITYLKYINTLRPWRRFPDDICKYFFLTENVWISINISLKFVPKGQINNIPALVQIMAWRRPGDKPLSEPMVVRLATHICVTRPQWVKEENWKQYPHGLSHTWITHRILKLNGQHIPTVV